MFYYGICGIIPRCRMIDLVSDRKNCQTVCKPGSVPSVSRDGWPFVWDVRCRTPRATYPGDGAKTRLRAETRHAAPIRSCSRCGLPCHRRYRRRGALLPHPFTLTLLRQQGFGGRFTFCGTFPGVAPAGRYPAPCFRGARTFLPPPGFPVAKGDHPTVWRWICGAIRGSGQEIAVRARRRARVSASRAPSTSAGRKWRWKAVSRTAGVVSGL